jgi:WD40 repeat protein
MANIWDWRNGKLLFVLNDCDDRDCNIQSVSFSPDSKHLALGTQNDYDEGKIQIWDIENKRILQKVEGYWVNGQNVAYSPENLQVLYTLSGEGEATNIDFSPDGTRLAIGYSNKEVILWDLESRRPVGALKGHLGPINCVAFSPDGKRLATASRDFTVRIWDIETGNMLLSFKELKGTIEQITFSPDSKNIATAASGIYGTDDPIKIFELEAGSLIRLWEQNGRRANLDLGQLQTFGLYELLDLKPGNEVNLIETGEVWQIKAFADLATAQVLDNDIISRASVFYSRADRLYNAALSLQDEDLIRKDYATMLRNYAKMYEPTDMLKSIDLEKKADKIWIEADEDVFQPAKIKNH